MDINVISPINQLGYGICGLNIVKALAANNDVALWIIGQGEAHPKEHELIRKCIDNTHVFNCKAPCLRIWHQFDMALHVGKRLHAGFPIFELDRFQPVETHHLKSLDFIFVCSEWAKKILLANNIGSEDTIKVAPFGVDREIFKPIGDTEFADANLAKGTTFLNIGKWEVRKGHDILIEAFNKAFSPADNVHLIMNCFNPFIGDNNNQWTSLYKKSKLGDKITILPNRLETQEDVAALMNSVDVGVFPARAEGWNLELLEMMACGKKVIATNYSGHTQFINSQNCMLIETEGLEDAYDGVFFNGQGQWAELGDKQIDQLVEYMRQCHIQKQNGEAMFNEAGRALAINSPWSKTAAKIEVVFNHERYNY